MRVVRALLTEFEQGLRPEFALHGMDGAQVYDGIFRAQRFLGQHAGTIEAAQGAGYAIGYVAPDIGELYRGTVAREQLNAPLLFQALDGQRKSWLRNV